MDMSGQSSEIFALARNAEGIHWTQPFRNHFETSVTGANTPSLDLDTVKYGAYFVGFSTNMDGCEVYADVDCTTTVAGLFSFESPASGLPKLICFKAANRNITKIYLKFKFYTGSTKTGRQSLEPAEYETAEQNEIIGKDNYNVSSTNNTVAGINNLLYTFTPFVQTGAPTEDIYISVSPDINYIVWTLGELLKELNSGSIRGQYPLSYCDLERVRLAWAVKPALSDPPPAIADIEEIGSVNIIDKSQMIFKNSDITYNQGIIPPTALVEPEEGETAPISIEYLYYLVAAQYSGQSSIVFQETDGITVNTVGTEEYGKSAVVGTNNEILSSSAIAIGHGNRSGNVQNAIIGIGNDVDGVHNGVAGSANKVRGSFNKVSGENNQIYNSNTTVSGDSNTIEFVRFSDNTDRATITGVINKTKLNWNVNDEELHQEGTQIATFKAEICTIANGVINFSVDPKTVLHCTINDWRDGQANTIGFYTIEIYPPHVENAPVIDTTISYQDGDILAHEIINGAGVLMNGTYLIKYYYSSSIVPENIKTAVVGFKNSITSPMNGSTLTMDESPLYTNVVGSENKTTLETNNIVGNLNNIRSTANIKITNNSILGNGNLINDQCQLFEGSTISGNDNIFSDVGANVGAYTISNARIYGNNNSFANTNDYTITNLACIGSVNTFGIDKTYILANSLMAGHSNVLKFTNNSQNDKLTILGHFNAIKSNVSMILGNDNTLDDSLDIDINTAFPEPRTINNKIIGDYNQISGIPTQSLIYGSENRLSGLYSAVFGQSNWVSGPINNVIGNFNKVDGIELNLCGRYNFIQTSNHSTINGDNNTIVNSALMLSTGNDNTGYYSDSVNFTGSNNMVVSSGFINCAGRDNKLYVLPPVGLTEVTDIEIALVLESYLTYSLAHLSKGRQLGIYPLSYCDLSTCKVYYSTTQNGADRTELENITVSGENATSITLNTLAQDHTEDFMYYLQTKQFVGRSYLVNAFTNVSATIDATHIILNTNLENIDTAFKPILCIHVLTTTLVYQYVLENIDSINNTFELPAGFIPVTGDCIIRVVYKLNSTSQTKEPYQDCIISGTTNNIFAKNNIITGSNNLASYTNNIIMGLNNAVDGAYVTVTGANNQINSMYSQVSGDGNILDLCNTTIQGNNNIVHGLDLMSRYENPADLAKTEYIKYGNARNSLYIKLSPHMDRIGSILKVDSEFIQKTNTMVKFYKETCTVADGIVNFSKPYKQICNLIINESKSSNMFDILYIDCTIKVLDYVGTAPNFWLSESGIKTDLLDGTYTFEYYYLPFYNVDSDSKIIGNNNRLIHKFNIFGPTGTTLIGDNNTTVPFNFIHGSFNQCHTIDNKIIGDSNLIRCADLVNETIPDNIVIGNSRNVQILGNSNNADIRNTSLSSYSSVNNNTRNYTNIIGMTNNINIRGYKNQQSVLNILGSNTNCGVETINAYNIENFYTNIVGSDNTIKLTTTNTKAHHINIIGSANEINPSSGSSYNTFNVFGNNNKVTSLVQNEIRNAAIFGDDNWITANVGTHNNYLICGRNNKLTLNANNNNIICLSDNEVIANCNNVAIIGKTTYAKTNLSDTVVMPGITNRGGEVINTLFTTGTTPPIIVNGFIERRVVLTKNNRFVYYQTRLEPLSSTPEINIHKIYLDLPTSSTGAVFEILLEIQFSVNLEDITIREVGNTTIVFTRPTGIVFEPSIGTAVITRAQFLNYKIKCTKVTSSRWIIEN